MSDRPVPSGEPGQPAGTPPQQAPAGGAQAPGLPPQSPSGAFGPADGFGPPDGAPQYQPQPQPPQVTPRPVSQPVPLVPQPGQAGPQPVQPQPVQPGPVQPGPVAPAAVQPGPAAAQPGPQPVQPIPVQAAPQPVQPIPGQAGPQPVQPIPVQAGPAGPAWPQQTGFPPAQPTVGSTPDWEALAARNEKDAKRRRRVKLIGAVTAVVVVAAAGAGYVLLTKGSKDGNGPTASGPSTAAVSTSASASASGSAAPTASASGPVKGIDSPPTVGSLPATKGAVALGLGSDAKTGSAPGYSGQVLKLPSGQNSFAQSASQVVDVSNSFTVSARVLVDVPNGNRSAVSQGDGQYYSYSLGRANNNGHDLWYFKVQVPGGGSAVAWSKGDATVNQWVVLTGVYDDPSGQITLYVNGAPQASAKSPGVPPSGANTLQIGRLSSNSQWSDPWHGAVADVQTWGQTLPEADIVKVVAGPSSPPATPPAAAWLTG
ncbi:LamG-like jellyroll fold domain-containing protein [Kitasatospora sp. NPDC048538]|uniref:LamG-like jellyroll fold domain-containing protein n=1 Tax=unclassified Kitasatospora TaxID=2633591 RepID=UPI00340FCA2F